MFKTLQEVDIFESASFKATFIGKVGTGIEVRITGEPIEAEGWIWHNVEGGELWIPERTLDGTQVLLAWTGIGTPPRPARTIALKDTAAQSTQKTSASASAPLPTLPPNVDLDPADYNRVYRAALAITRAFEGGGFDSLNTFDKGVVSYGIMQFTLGSGSLGRVLEKYLSASSSDTANQLRQAYQARVQSKEAALRNDTRFHSLLKAAALEETMQKAQFEIAQRNYWDVVLENYVQRRGNLRLPLTYALLFDMGINFGVNHSYVRRAEEMLGVPSNSRPGDNGITEKQLITKVAELRREAHYKQAEKENLPGLKPRGDFWVTLIESGDWGLQGDANGFVYPKKGAKVQVRNPF